jgi:hypothetical protein
VGPVAAEALNAWLRARAAVINAAVARMPDLPGAAPDIFRAADPGAPDDSGDESVLIVDR